MANSRGQVFGQNKRCGGRRRTSHHEKELRSIAGFLEYGSNERSLGFIFHDFSGAYWMATKVLISTREEILERSIPLFAHSGFHGVSMRDIAAAVGMQAAALYHHFPDKQALYLSALAHAFKDKSAVLAKALAIPGTPLARLDRFVDALADSMGRDHNCLVLLQREQLDGDEARLKLITQEVFVEPFNALVLLAKELAPAHDPHMVATSICALVMYHLETASMRRFFPGCRPTHDNPKIIAKHVRALLAQLFADGDQK